jgi:hypothetical protein
MKVSKNLIARIWKEADLRPHPSAPNNAAVFCVDEKSAIQALGRLDRHLPLSPGRAEKPGFQYYLTAMGPSPSMRP